MTKINIRQILPLREIYKYRLELMEETGPPPAPTKEIVHKYASAHGVSKKQAWADLRDLHKTEVTAYQFLIKLTKSKL